MKTLCGLQADQMLFIIVSCVLVGDLEGLEGESECLGLLFPDAALRVLRVERPGMGPGKEKSVA